MLNLAGLLLLAAMPKVGDPAPSFQAQDSAGRPLALAEMLKAGPVVVAFFPKPFTPGCTRELAAYQGMHEALAAAKVQVVAVAWAGGEQMQAFRDSLGAGYAFVPDPDGVLIGQFGARQLPLRMAKRVSFLIGQDGKILRIDSGRGALDPKAMLDWLAAGATKPG